MELQKNGGTGSKTQLQVFVLFSNDTLKFLGIIAVARIKIKFCKTKKPLLTQPAIVSYEKVPQTQTLKQRGMVKKFICKIPSRGKFGKRIQVAIFFNSGSL